MDGGMEHAVSVVQALRLATHIGAVVRHRGQKGERVHNVALAPELHVVPFFKIGVWLKNEVRHGKAFFAVKRHGVHAVALADDLGGLPAGQFRHGLVPQNDLAVRIHDVQRLSGEVAHVVQRLSDVLGGVPQAYQRHAGADEIHDRACIGRAFRFQKQQAGEVAVEPEGKIKGPRVVLLGNAAGGFGLAGKIAGLLIKNGAFLRKNRGGNRSGKRGRTVKLQSRAGVIA